MDVRRFIMSGIGFIAFELFKSGDSEDGIYLIGLGLPTDASFTQS